MAKKKVKLDIKNNDGESSINTIGIVKNNRMTFFDDHEQQHRVQWDAKKVYYQRSGAHAFSFIFELNQTHLCDYKVDNHILKLRIKTRVLNILKDEIEVVYDIIEDNTPIHTNHIKLTHSKLGGPS